jgi:hypothetical protein
LQVEGCQEAYDRVTEASALSSGQDVFAADRSLQELNPNILNSCGHSNQGAAKRLGWSSLARGLLVSYVKQHQISQQRIPFMRKFLQKLGGN